MGTHQKVQLASSFWIMLVVSLLSFRELSHASLGITHLASVFVAVYYRQELRKKFGLDFGSPETITQDVLIWCCCFVCAAAQEARQIERVRIPSERCNDVGVSRPIVGEAIQIVERRNPELVPSAPLVSSHIESNGSDSPRSTTNLLSQDWSER